MNESSNIFAFDFNLKHRKHVMQNTINNHYLSITRTEQQNSLFKKSRFYSNNNNVYMYL